MKNFQPETYSREIRAGNRLAFSDFFRKNHDRFVRYSMKYVHSKDDALDIVQEVFVNLWNNRLTIDPEKSLLTYLFVSVRNRSLNFIRDSKDLTSLDETQIPEELEENDSLTELQMVLKESLEHLPERQREAFELSRFEGLQHDEIASIMNVSSRTVNNHIVAALKALRERVNVILKKAAN